MRHIRVEDLSMNYGESPVLKHVSLDIPDGKITALIGGNGSGKTTLLRIIARLLKPTSGVAYLHGQSIHQLSTRTVAQQLAILPQAPVTPEGMTVRELVSQGRYPYQTWYRQWSDEDEEKVSWALRVTNMEALANRFMDALSGGQRQRAWIAMALAQGTSLLLLDEPTTYLDLAHQVEVLELLCELNRMQQCTVVMVLHDLNQAARYADHLVVLKQGEIVAEGEAGDILTEALVKDAFGLDCVIAPDPITATPMCIPLMKRARELTFSE